MATTPTPISIDNINPDDLSLRVVPSNVAGGVNVFINNNDANARGPTGLPGQAIICLAPKAAPDLEAAMMDVHLGTPYDSNEEIGFFPSTLFVNGTPEQMKMVEELREKLLKLLLDSKEKIWKNDSEAINLEVLDSMCRSSLVIPPSSDQYQPSVNVKARFSRDPDTGKSKGPEIKVLKAEMEDAEDFADGDYTDLARPRRAVVVVRPSMFIKIKTSEIYITLNLVRALVSAPPGNSGTQDLFGQARAINDHIVHVKRKRDEDSQESQESQEPQEPPNDQGEESHGGKRAKVPAKVPATVEEEE